MSCCFHVSSFFFFPPSALEITCIIKFLDGLKTFQIGSVTDISPLSCKLFNSEHYALFILKATFSEWIMPCGGRLFISY